MKYLQMSKSSTILIIPRDVYRIEKFEFASRMDICGVIFHRHVTEIGEGAFKFCCNLAGVLSLPADLIHIGEFAFYGCGLTRVIISGSLKWLSPQSFGMNELLESVSIPCSTAIDDDAFERVNKHTIKFDLIWHVLVIIWKGRMFRLYDWHKHDNLFEMMKRVYPFLPIFTRLRTLEGDYVDPNTKTIYADLRFKRKGPILLAS